MAQHDTPEIPHKIKRNPLTGALTVHFACPLCKVELNAPVADAGTVQSCPQCSGKIRFPGSEEKRADQRRREQETEEKRRADERKAAERAIQAAQREAESEAMSRERHAQVIREDRSRKRSPHTGWCDVSGTLLVIVGVVLLALAVFMDTSVASPGAFSSVDRVYNLGLLNARLVASIGGTGFFVAGALLKAVASLGKEINRWGSGPSA